MITLKAQIRWTMALAMLAILAGILSHLALTDIAHGGEDLSQEWTVVRASAFILIIFIGFVLLTLKRVMKQL